MRDQGQYLEARNAYEESLKIDRNQGDIRNQAITLGQLAKLAQIQHDFDEARVRHTEARDLFHTLGEPAMESVAWYQLGTLALEQNDWDEAERCYRETLALDEHQGDLVGAAKTSNQLAIVAQRTGSPAEAESWFKRALALDEQANPGSFWYAHHLSNLAYLLVNETRVGHVSLDRLAEARSYAEQAMAIIEPLGASAEIWKTLGILAQIAEMQGQAEAARAYRRRERETFAAFEGNRYHIDRQHGRLISVVAAAARGNAQARTAVEEALPKLEAGGWHISAAIQRIWAGEREWHALAEGIDINSTLLILRILETLAQPPAEGEKEIDPQFGRLILAVVAAARGQGQARTAVEKALPQVEADGWHIAAAIRRIWAGERDLPALVEGLDDDDALIVGRILDLLEQPPSQDEAEEEGDGFEALAAAVALAAGGYQEARAAVEEALPQLEAKGWQIADAIRRIWAGERDTAALVAGLDEQETQLIQRILALLAQEPGG